MSITIEREVPLAEINLSSIASYGYKRYEPIIKSLGFKITSTPVNNESEKYNLGYKKGNDTLNLGIITFSSSESKGILEAAFSSYDFVLTKIAPQNNVPNSTLAQKEKKPLEEKKSLFQKAKELYKSYKLARKYVDAVLNLPPTYTIGEIGNFNQIVPDPETPDSIQIKIDEVNKAEKDWSDFWEEKSKNK